MCGIVACINKNPRRGYTHKSLEVFSTLLLLDTLRGKDSTGVYAVDANGNVSIAKDIVTGGEFTKSKEYQEIHRKMYQNGFALVGHNRAATRGVVTDTNAHPFWYEDKVVLVHNGTFVGDHKKHADVEVDSEALAHLLGQHEVDQVEDVFNKINAAYACVWYDTRDTSINIIRNEQRPLHWFDAGDCYFVSSEKQILMFALARNDIKFKHDDIYMLVHDTQTKLKMDDNKVDLFNIDINIKPYSYVRTVVTAPAQQTTTALTVVPKTVSEPNKIDEATKTVIDNGQIVDSFRSEPGNKSSLGDRIKTDLGPNPPTINHQRYERLRDFYPTDGKLSFYPRGVVPTGNAGEFVLYGGIVNDPEVIAAVVVGDACFLDIIDSHYVNNIIDIDITSAHFMVTKPSLVCAELEGIGIVYGKNPSQARLTGDYNAC